MMLISKIAGVSRDYTPLITAVFFLLLLDSVACSSQETPVIKETATAEKTPAVEKVSLASKAPKIEVDKTLLDFGVIYSGDSPEGIFIISNKGDSTLRIEDVRTSCGCTAAVLDEKIIEPDQRTKINARFSSARYKGKVSKSIYVRTNDPQNPITTLTIQADVKVDLEVTPQMVYFSGLKEGEKVSRNISLKNLSESTITIQEISSTIPAVKIELSKMKIAPGEEVNLALVIEDIKKEMSLSGYITIHNSSHQDKVSVRVYGGKIK